MAFRKLDTPVIFHCCCHNCSACDSKACNLKCDFKNYVKSKVEAIFEFESSNGITNGIKRNKTK